MNRDVVTIPIRDRSKKPEVAYSKHDGVIVINITKPEQAECFICKFCLFCHPEFIDKTWETQGGKAWEWKVVLLWWLWNPKEDIERAERSSIFSQDFILPTMWNKNCYKNWSLRENILSPVSRNSWNRRVVEHK